MEIGGVPNNAGSGVRGGEDPLARFQILEPDDLPEQRVKYQLAEPVVSVPMEGVDEHLKEKLECLVAKGASADC